jgi:hypothetical protein
MTYETTFLEVRKEWKQGEKAGEGGVDPAPCSKVNYSVVRRWSVNKNFTLVNILLSYLTLRNCNAWPPGYKDKIKLK